MAENINAPHDDNAVPTALFAISTSVTNVAPGQIDEITGRVLVDVSGGISTTELGQEVPTGTVNGVNLIFTVENNPVFGDVSGQVMVSSVQNPTNYGYVVSGTGPYTLTYVNAPTQTPDSFYNYPGTGSSIASLLQSDTFTATNGQTVFTTSIPPVFVFSVVAGDQPQTLTTDYTQVGSVFTLNTGVPAGTVVVITYLHN